MRDIEWERRTLKRCGLSGIIDYKNDRGDFRVKAESGSFEFYFQNYYWVSKGPVDIALAIQMYENAVGKTDIRSGGHCGCLHPMEYGVKWIAADGREVISEDQRAEFKRLEHLEGVFAPEEVTSSYIFNDDPKSIGARGIVDTYHIDSELGLYIFVKTIMGD